MTKASICVCVKVNYKNEEQNLKNQKAVAMWALSHSVVRPPVLIPFTVRLLFRCDLQNYHCVSDM